MTIIGAGVKAFSTVDNGSSGSDNPFYSGLTLSALNWSSLAWADINGVLALSDDIEFEISRAGSTWTFNQAGIYYFHLSINTGALNSLMGFRWLDDTLTSIINFTGWAGGAPDSPQMHFQGLLPVNAAEDEFTLQYIRQANAGGVFSTVNLGGEDLTTARLSIFKIGNIAA